MSNVKLSLLIFIILFTDVYALQKIASFETIQKKNIVMRFEKGISEQEAKEIFQQLDSLVKDWKKKLNIKTKSKSEFRFYFLDKSYMSKSGAKFNQIVYLNKGAVHISPVARLTENIKRSLPQAVVLSILAETNKNGCPNWLTEAYAYYISNQVAVNFQPLSTFYNIKDFQQEYYQIKKESQYKVLLAKAISLIIFLKERYGIEKLNSLFSSYDGIRTDEQIYEKVFNEKYDLIERYWNEDLQKNR